MRYTAFLAIAAIFLFVPHVGFSEGGEEASEGEKNLCEQIMSLKADRDSEGVQLVIYIEAACEELFKLRRDPSPDRLKEFWEYVSQAGVTLVDRSALRRRK